MTSGKPIQLAYVGLGGNIGSPGQIAQRFRDALRAVDLWPDTRVEAVSSLYTSDPVDATGPEYLNAVARLRTNLDPGRLLTDLLALESRLGRTREFHHAPRTLDLDLLLYGDTTIQSECLIVPHPRMTERAFVLIPLAEVVGESDLEIPGQGWLMARMAALPGPQRVEKLTGAGEWWGRSD